MTVRNCTHIFQADTVLWCYYCTSSIVISKNYFEGTSTGLLPDKTVGNTVPRSLQGHRADNWVAQWNVFPFKHSDLHSLWMNVSLLPAIAFSQINVKLLMWVIYILTSAPRSGEDHRASVNILTGCYLHGLAYSLSLFCLLGT